MDQDSKLKFSSPWSLKQNIGRALWMLTWKMVFRPSFHNWYGFRNRILRLFGAKVGQQVRIRPTARIEIPWNLEIGDYSVVGDDAILYSLGKITIGERVVISQFAHLCAGTHDFRYRSFPLLKPPITINSDAWIASDAFVGPGVTVGEGTVLGARSSAFNDLPAFQVCIGSPARAVKQRVMFDWDPAGESGSIGQSTATEPEPAAHIADEPNPTHPEAPPAETTIPG
jgi:putative colanic acid biosynthesis acetyltransferase WcaF